MIIVGNSTNSNKFRRKRRLYTSQVCLGTVCGSLRLVWSQKTRYRMSSNSVTLLLVACVGPSAG